MNAASRKIVTYKWNPKTSSGYRLRYDSNYPMKGLHRRFVLEAWDNLTIVDDWGCDTVEEMVHVLESLFEVDEKKEIEKIRSKFEVPLAAIA